MQCGIRPLCSLEISLGTIVDNLSANTFDTISRQKFARAVGIGGNIKQGIQSILYCSAIGNLPVWIIDSGATDHCSLVLDMFSTYRPIDHKYVRLPNGNNIVVEFSGEVHITDSIILTDLLYLPSFSFNLISVHKLFINGSTSNCVDATDTTSVKSDTSTSVIAEQKQTPNLTVEEYQGLIALLKANTMKRTKQ
ncbi:hypothetical protein MTR_4g127990 [Medicago truncatula]|uniref:Retrovirus-related Pol polyprotein from transposon TNT 1-94-like beta-barrel domain-containing protein n=1 Tax=Medicago truncatula TaxID=3880 RepID=G7JVE4_MEDTR|nr:hypothetical protein MTR_4g127990 [Medicago truncatula]